MAGLRASGSRVEGLGFLCFLRRGLGLRVG